jgi:hypothetical protein
LYFAIVAGFGGTGAAAGPIASLHVLFSLWSILTALFCCVDHISSAQGFHLPQYAAAGLLCRVVLLSLRDEFFHDIKSTIITHTNRFMVDSSLNNGVEAQSDLLAVGERPDLVNDRSLMTSSVISITTLFLDASYGPCVAAFLLGWESGLALHSYIHRLF